MYAVTPRVVRNFWIDAKIDGRAADIGAGPKAKDGGFELTIYMRRAGEVNEAISIRGYENGGNLVLWAQGPDGQRIEITTER